MPLSGIEPQGEQIGQQVGQHIKTGDHQHATLHQWIIAALNRFNCQQSQPRPVKYGFGNHCAAEHAAQLQGEHGQQRHGGQTGCMAPPDALFGNAEGACGAGGVHAHRFQP